MVSDSKSDHIAKKWLNRVGARTQPCLTSTDRETDLIFAIDSYSSRSFVVQGFDNVEQLGWQMVTVLED